MGRERAVAYVSLALVVGVVTILTALIGLGLAVVVLVAAPTRATNRWLAALLATDALATLPGVFGTFVDDRVLDYNVWLFFVGLLYVNAIAYAMFLGPALDTPLTRPLRSGAFRRTMIVVIPPLFIIGYALPGLSFSGPGHHIPDLGWLWDVGPLYQGCLMAFNIVAVYGLAANVMAFRGAPVGTIARERAKAYLVAFATQDIGYFLVLGYNLLYPQDLNTLNVGNTAVTLAFSVLVAVGLLRTQLFDFDLRVKNAFKRGAVAAAFLVPFFGVTAFASRYFEQYGYVAGGVAVGALLLVFGPIQRGANVVADRLFPGVSNEEEYLMRKKVALYRDALHDARLPTGQLDTARTDTLRKLRASLGLTPRDHEMILASLASEPATLATRGGSVVAPGALVLGKYRVERELGKGGGGRAFLATDARIGRRVVVKAIAGLDHAAALREARAAAAIDHPNVVRVYDVEDLGAEALLVMEYVEGGSLKDRIATAGPLADAAFERLGDDLLSALEAVHEAGAIHRDIKPGNVLLTLDGRAKVSDFGVARMGGYETTMGEPTSGTVAYMSPEQARGRRVAASSDLYSAAATLYEARGGKPLVAPREGESAVELRARIGDGASTPNDAPPELQAWFERALAVAPDARFQSAREMRDALAAALHRGA